MWYLQETNIMQPLFLPSFAIYTTIYSSILTASLCSPPAAADPAGSDEWMPTSTSGNLHAISVDNDSLPVDTLGLKLNGQGQAATDYSEYSRTINNSVVQEQILLEIYNQYNNVLLPAEKDFTQCLHRRELLNNYSNASSAFIECAVKNAKPVLYCGNCVLEFELSKKAWHNIENDAACKEDILVSDKLQIVSQTQTFLAQLWHDGYCQNCYDEKQNFNATNSTHEFIQRYIDTWVCFRNNGGSSDIPIPFGSNLTLCRNCSTEYEALNNLYNGFSDDQLCMDIIDLMNRTRVLWKDYHCRKTKKEYLAVIVLTVFICILPFFFYLTAMIHGTKKQQRLVEKSKKGNQRGLSASARLYAGTTTSLR